MKKISLLSGAFLVLIVCASRNASAQAATEYGLASGSSATSVSSVGKNLNQKMGRTNSHSSATAHTVQPSGSKQRNVNSRPTATASNRLPKQPGTVGAPAAKGVPQSGFVVVGAEHPSGSEPAAHPVGSSQSGLTVVGAEPR